MIGGLTALILLSALHVIQTINVPHQISLTETKVGDNVTLTCGPLGPEKSLSYWYKMNFGDNIQTIFQGTFQQITPKGQFENSRFDFKKVGDVFFFEIRNISKEDEGTYICQAGAAYAMEFINVTFLAVKGRQIVSKAENGMKQNSELESVPLGSTVNLSCRSKYNENSDQCPGEQTVYWYRAGSASHPGAIYKSRVVCEDPGRRSCSYHLSKTIQNSLDAGIYYCAVLACGEILFGRETKVEIKPDMNLPAIVLGVLLASCVLVNVVLILSRKKPKPVCDRCEGKSTSSNDAQLGGSTQQSHLDGEEDGLNYVALDFPSRKAKRWKNKRESTDECTYSSMK